MFGQEQASGRSGGAAFFNGLCQIIGRAAGAGVVLGWLGGTRDKGRETV